MPKRKSSKKKSPTTKRANWKLPRLKGLTFAFTGQIYKSSNITEASLARLIRSEGGKIVDAVSPVVDYLVSLGRKTSRREINKADRLNAAGEARIHHASVISVLQMFVPSRAESIEMLRAGSAGVRRWSKLSRYTPQIDIDLRGFDLRKADLQGVDLSRVAIDGLDFRGADLSRAKLGPVRHLALDGAKLVKIDTHHILDSSLVGADLTGADCGLRRCCVDDTRLTNIRMDCMIDCSARNATLENITWSMGDNITGNDFEGATLRNQGFAASHLKGCNFRNADMRDAVFYECNLTGLDLSGSDCRGANFGYANLKNAIVDGADFTGAVVRLTNLQGVDVNSAKGLAEAHKPPKGKAGRRVRELSDVASKSAVLFVAGRADLDDGRVRFELRWDQRTNWPPTTAIFKHTVKGREKWFTLLAGDRNRSYTRYLMDIAGYWPDARLHLKSLKVRSQKAPIKGKQLKELVFAALCEAWGQSPEGG